MAAAVQEITQWILESTDYIRVFARCNTINIGSARVLEKSGFIREAILRGSISCPHISAIPQDCAVYAINDKGIK